tara:strand:+ start:502 stop:2331 length:1830 start_codon:yes stop_codon:yes gene_type:complete
MFRFIYSLVLSIFLSFIYSDFVSIDYAKKISNNIMTLKYPNHNNLKIESIYNIKEDLNTLIYVINYHKKGFVLVSADDRVNPLLGYSFNNYYSEDDLPIQLKDMITFFKKQIIYVIDNNIASDQKIKDLWAYYLSDDINYNNRNVDPLMTTNWDQGHSWNDHCPEDDQGPGGNVYAGCVATAAAMVMKYWNHPQSGQGSHAYNHSDYGLITANFNTIYDWDSMSNNSPTEASRKLLFHVGVSCEMGYGPYGSGAWVGEYEPSVTTALKTYFKYDQGTIFLSKNNYDDVFWVDIVKSELDQGRPLVYKGYTADYGAGHAFVIDGYDGDYFHLNWGWSGSYNGWYLINNLSPGGYNFSTWQGAIFNLYPEVEQILGCTDTDACNYNEDANTNDGSCEYIVDCFGVCGGDAIVDECGECNGDGSLCSGNAILTFGNINTINQTFDILFDTDIELAGFQFTISDTPDNIILDSFNGGYAEDYDFSVSCSESGIVIGFSFDGETIPVGSGILSIANYSITGDDLFCDLCFQDVILSNQYGNAINTSIGDCVALELCTFSGNINNDGMINILDVVIMVNMILDEEETILCESDINQDGILNVQDIIILINMILNL